MRTQSGASEEKNLLHSFKYYDLENKGKASLENFLKICHKYGVHGNAKMDLEKMFKHYDTMQQGFIYYKEFVAAVFNHPMTDGNSTTVHT